jgi:hypothetical protein
LDSREVWKNYPQLRLTRLFHEAHKNAIEKFEKLAPPAVMRFSRLFFESIWHKTVVNHPMDHPRGSRKELESSGVARSRAPHPVTSGVKKPKTESYRLDITEPINSFSKYLGQH